MRQWRVGTLSMGLVLIATGIILLVGQFNQFSIIKSILNWWPLVLILLGSEILIYLKFAKTDQMIIKYDFLSVIFIAFLGLFTLGFYSLTTTGVLDYFSERFLVQTYTLPLEETTLVVPEDIGKLKIMGSKENLKLLTGDSDEMLVFGNISINASSEEEAKKMLPENILKTYITGNILLLDFNSSTANFNRSTGNLTLVVPKNLPLEIEGLNYNHLKVEVDNLESDWLINSQGSVDVLLLSNENLEINTLVPRASYLEGTVQWQEQDLAEEGLGSNSVKYYRSSAKWGEGKHKLKIISEGRVSIITP
ncbi:MAG: DUF5668 domain-containing protein [Bacillota bacterium]